MKPTYEHLFNFLRISQAWLAKSESNAKIKLGYAIERVAPRVQKALQVYQSKLEEVDLDHCATDKDGIVLRDEHGQFRFKPDQEKLRNAARQSLFESEVEDFKPYFATKVPEDLTYLERYAFWPVVLEADPNVEESEEPNEGQ